MKAGGKLLTFEEVRSVPHNEKPKRSMFAITILKEGT